MSVDSAKPARIQCVEGEKWHQAIRKASNVHSWTSSLSKSSGRWNGRRCNCIFTRRSNVDISESGTS